MTFFSVLLNCKSALTVLSYSTLKDYSRMLKYAENPFQRAFNVTQQLYIQVLYCAEMFLADFKMLAVFLAKLQWRDHSPKQDKLTDV